MPLPSQTLAAIQSAGAAIFTADLELKKSVQDYADQVKEAMLQNPFDMGNDTRFEDWKTVARLSQAIAQIEAEFKKIYNAASDLSAASRTSIAVMPTLMAPQAMASENDLPVVKEIEATDAVIKKVAIPKRPSAPKKGGSQPLKGNTAKVLARMSQILTATKFTKVNQSAVALEIGLAKGSIGASISKLIRSGQLVAGPSGTFKLGDAKAAD